MISCDICTKEVDVMIPPQGSTNPIALALVPVEINTYGYNIKTDIMYDETSSLKGLSSFVHKACLERAVLTERLVHSDEVVFDRVNELNFTSVELTK